MKLHWLFFLSHTLTAAVLCTVLWAAELSGGGSFGIATGTIALATLGGVSVLLARSFRKGLALLESLVANPGEPAGGATGIRELDRAAQRLSERAARWDEMAANSREQAREIQVVLTRLNRRAAGSEMPGSELRQLLAGIGQTLHGNLEQVEQHAAEISRCTEEIAGGAETQSNAITKTSTYVEQLAANIDSVSSNAKLVQTALLEARGSAGEATKLVDELVQGLDRIRLHSEASETKLRGLSDPSRQISSIVETIGDISARTDLLALNASIESIRAGEHGRGFAVVAEEVRKSAEQTAQATREIAGLIDSMQLATQESVARIAQERAEVQAEATLAEAAAGILAQIHTATGGEASRAGEIALAAHQQLQLTQDVVLAVEQISHIAKSSRSRAENACWTTRSLANLRRQFGESIDQLRACSEKRREGEANNHHTPERHPDGAGARAHREVPTGAGRPAIEVPAPAEV